MNPLPEGFGIKLVAVQLQHRRRLDYVMVTPKCEIRLTEQQGGIMAALLANYGKFVQRSHLFEALWGDDEDGGPLEGEKVIEVHLCQMRRELRAAGVDFEKKSVQECGGSKMRLWNLRECEPYGTAPKKLKLAWPERKARSARLVAKRALECTSMAQRAGQGHAVDHKLMQARQAFEAHQAKPLTDLWAKPAPVEEWEARKGARS